MGCFLPRDVFRKFDRNEECTLAGESRRSKASSAPAFFFGTDAVRGGARVVQPCRFNASVQANQ
jgi:hypothetical protein